MRYQTEVFVQRFCSFCTAILDQSGQGILDSTRTAFRIATAVVLALAVFNLFEKSKDYYSGCEQALSKKSSRTAGRLLNKPPQTSLLPEDIHSSVFPAKGE